MNTVTGVPSPDRSVAVLSAWNTSSLGDAAAEWRLGSDGLYGAADRTRTAVTGISHGDLSGSIRDAVDRSLNRTADSLGRDGNRMSIAASYLEDGGERISSAIRELRLRVSLAESTGFTVHDDGTCVPSVDLVLGQVVVSAFAPAPGHGFRAALGLAMLHSRRITGAMDQVIEADADTAVALSGAHPGPLGDGPTSLTGDARANGVDSVNDTSDAIFEAGWLAERSGGRLLESGPDHGTSGVIAYGAALTDADHVIILVPGTGSDLSDPDSVVDQSTKAHGLLAGATVPTAVLVAMHDAPGHVTSAAGDRYHPAAADQIRTVAARAAESTSPGARISVAGFSHGAVVAAQATQGPGLRADSVMLIGSPGAGPGLRSTDGMKLVDQAGKRHDNGAGGDSRVLVANDPADIVTHTPKLRLHGADPADDAFGALPVELPDSGRTIPGTGPHSSYFTDRRAMRSITKALETAVGN